MWILAKGVWNDNGVWIDNAVWYDTAPVPTTIFVDHVEIERDNHARYPYNS